jgi:hypothetical protein
MILNWIFKRSESMENTYERLESLCLEKLAENHLTAHKSRLQQELQQISIQKEWSYVLKLYDKGVKVSNNEHNVLVYYLLGICLDINLDKQASYTEPSYPDEQRPYNQ